MQSGQQSLASIGYLRARRPATSVLVATAYMDEAEGFGWLVAMDAGRILATGSLAERRAGRATRTLEEAFVSLLPEDKRREHRALLIPPRPLRVAVCAAGNAGVHRREPALGQQRAL